MVVEKETAPPFPALPVPVLVVEYEEGLELLSDILPLVADKEIVPPLPALSKIDCE